MKFLIVGLGSMGKRRIRNLRALSEAKIFGWDTRADRRQEAADSYGIEIISELDKFNDFDALIISTPPDKHEEYIKFAIERKKPCLVELNILLGNLIELDRLAKVNKVLIAPSCTFKFHPCIMAIKNIVKSGIYGKIKNFNYHSGQYLPDWHPWENVDDFFVSKKQTSGCKELFSFELHWLNEIMGLPKEIFIYSQEDSFSREKLDETCIVTMKFDNFIGILLIDVVSRFATRSLILNLEEAQIRWFREEAVKIYIPSEKKWISYSDSIEKSNKNCEKNSFENMYVEEMRAFLKVVKGARNFPNSLEEDIEILKIVEKM